MLSQRSSLLFSFFSCMLLSLASIQADDVLPRALNGLRSWQGAVFQHDMTTTIRLDTKRIADGTAVSGTFADQPISGSVQNSILSIAVPGAVAPGGPYTLTVTVGKDTAVLNDCYVGEVWLCVGQSNMMFPMTRLHSPTTYAPAANDSFPLIRQKTGKGWQAATSIAVIKNMAGTPYYFGRSLHQALNVPIGLVTAGQGGTSLWAWTPEDLHQTPELAPFKAVMVERSAQLKSAMDAKEKIAKQGFFKHFPGLTNGRYPYFPIRFGSLDYSDWLPKYASRGIVFWQGENDNGLNAHYEKLMTAMIKLWRSKSDREWPFIFIQLPSYRAGPNTNPLANDKYPGFAGQRDAQRRVAEKLDQVEMMVALDIYGEKPDIHPSNKEGYGTRLAQTVLGAVYGHDVPWRSPAYERAEFNGNTVTVHFKHSGAGLRSRTGDTSVRDVLLAGADRVFHPATATITGPTTITVTSDAVSNPVAVRYAWRQSPFVDIIGDGDLPASPFRSDDWELFP